MTESNSPSSGPASSPGDSRTAPLGPMFWLMMLIADIAGQTVSDAVSGRFGLDRPGGLAVAGVLAAAAMVVVFAQKHYVPWSYWAAVTAVAMLGNALADHLAGYFAMTSLAAAAVFAVALVAILALWSAHEHTLSVWAVATVRQEAFYWLAIVVTMALGTSLGDVVADRLGLGDRATALAFAAAVAAVAAGHFRRVLRPVPAFWLGFVLMQPMSNSLGDLVSQPTKNGGLGAGPLGASVLLLALLAALVLYEIRDTRRRAA